MKVRKILILCIGIIIVSMPVTRAISDVVQAHIVNYKIEAHYELNRHLKYPLLSYNNNTYIAVRDMADVWNKNVQWSEEDNKISLNSYKGDGVIIKKEETAMSIGKAILKEYFSDKISDKSKYNVTLAQVQGTAYDDNWWVSVVFESEEEVDAEYVMLNPDARVEINSATGNFSVLEMQNGVFNKLVEMKNW